MSERFEHPALDKLYAAIKVIEDAERTIRETRESLPSLVEELPALIGDNEDLREEIFHELYWFHEKVPSPVLKKVFQITDSGHAKRDGTSNVMRLASLDIDCISCNRPCQITARNKSEYKNIKYKISQGYTFQCNECTLKKDQAWKEKYERQRIEEEARLQELRTMPYYDYLQTPEWQQRRKRIMKKAGFRCQVCNAYGVRLNVHHRTYERRGNEPDRDLITLCQQCHEIFHKNGQLAVEKEG